MHSPTYRWKLHKINADKLFIAQKFKEIALKYTKMTKSKIGPGGSLLQRTSSSDRKATATNQMHSSDLETFGKKYCYFWFHWEVKFLTSFWTWMLYISVKPVHLILFSLDDFYTVTFVTFLLSLYANNLIN